MGFCEDNSTNATRHRRCECHRYRLPPSTRAGTRSSEIPSSSYRAPAVHFYRLGVFTAVTIHISSPPASPSRQPPLPRRPGTLDGFSRRSPFHFPGILTTWSRRSLGGDATITLPPPRLSISLLCNRHNSFGPSNMCPASIAVVSHSVSRSHIFLEILSSSDCAQASSRIVCSTVVLISSRYNNYSYRITIISFF